MPAARPNLPEALNHHPLFKRFISGREDATGRLGIRAARYEKQAHQLLAGGTREELGEAAHLFGMLNQGSINDSFSQGIHESYTGLAYTMRLWPSADPDETIELAAMVLEHSASELEDRDELRLAAIARTNRAVLFLEKRQLAADDRQRAQSDIDFSFKHKSRGTLDWSYSLHALALLRFQLPYDAERRVPELIAAKKLFRKSQSEVWDDLSDHQALTAVSQVALTEVRILQSLRTQAELRSITAHAHELPPHLQAAALKTPADLGLMVSNPQALGLHATPDWLGKDLLSQQAEQSRRGEAVRCSRELADELQINPTQSAAREHAESNLTLLNWLLEPTAETYAARIQALGIAATTHYPAEYFRKGVQILFDGYSKLGIEPSGELLRNLADAYLRVLRERQQSRIEAFVEQNPNQIRFVACWLAETAQWHESFDLLELTRGILTAPDPTSSPPAARAHAIHVTHSPKSTYVVVRQPDGTFDGRLLPDLAGPVLSRLWSDLFENVPPVLATPTSSGDRNRYAALNTATVKLGQIVDAVHELVPDDEPIVLCPGGLYSYLPVPAMIACGRTGETSRPVICSVTASRVTLENTTNRQLPSLVTLDASHTSPESALPFAAAEIKAIRRSFPAFRTTPKPATIENCVSTFRSGGIAHYSGHSAAHPADPRQSVLLLEDGTLSANQILSAAPLQSDLVVLSSCESGLATTATLSDEYLSIQTALLNGGCTRSIGTLWRVSDVSAGVFFAHFYRLLSSAEEFTTSSICRTMISSQQWLRHATTGEVVALLDAMGIEQSLLPDHPVFRDPTAQPFEHIVHWGPYYVVSTSL